MLTTLPWKSKQNAISLLNYEEKDEHVEELDEMQKIQEEAGVRCGAADPRYIKRRADDGVG